MIDQSKIDRDRICIKGKMMSMKDAHEKGYLTLLPNVCGDHDFEKGYHDFSYERPEEEILTSLDLDTEMVSLGKGKKSICLKEAIEDNLVVPIRAKVIVGYEYA